MGRNYKIYHKIWNNYNPDDPIQEGDGYSIHHKDGNPNNNDIDNLIKLTNSEHWKIHSKGINNPMYGKHHTEEAKEKISKGNKGKYLGENNPIYGKNRKGELNPMFGKYQTNKTKEK